ncbi:MAG: extracellular solute-binding protein [Roseburia sp.]|nr:extracellular solute-binding protein [Roseburia sp.]MCM1097116.1 extracellular solute-binding protein [Ruminococcus flavefaciens]
MKKPERMKSMISVKSYEKTRNGMCAGYVQNSIKKRLGCFLLAALLAFPLCGCGKEAGTPDGGSAPGTGGSQEGTEGSAGELNYGAEEVLDASAILSLAGKDNSLDALSLVLNVPVRTMEMDVVVHELEQLFLGGSGACRYKKIELENAEESVDVLSLVDAQGESDSIVFDSNDRAYCMGPVWGTDHYLVLDSEEGRRLIRETDGKQTLREIPLDFFEGMLETMRGLPSLAMDASGAIHMLRSIEGQWHYYRISPEGELLADYCPAEGEISGLATLYDGRVAFRVKEKSPGTRTGLWYLEPGTGEAVCLAELDREMFRLTFADENTLLYVDAEGVYRVGLSGGEPELLYRWSNHGIRATDVCALQAEEDGRIDLIYEGFGDWNYLRLEPTTEEVEVRKITMAVSAIQRSIYQSAVTAFNRRYPACQIELKYGYDETALMTELIAGSGPVLIDTALTGFEDQKKLWQPLDAVMEQMGVLEELHASAVNLGRIDGTLYGVTTDFELSTVVTGRQDVEDWDYETFLRLVEESDGLEAIFNTYGGDYGTYFITSFLSHGLEDNYLMDAETATTIFDSDEFRRILMLAKKYCLSKEAVNPGSSILEGKVFCNELGIMKPEDLALYRGVYGEDVNYIGYPTKDGAAHFIDGWSPLAIRGTASREEKEIACAFLRFLLSRDVAREASTDSNYHLSVRKDVLEEQIAAMDEDTMTYISGFEQTRLGDLLNREADAKKLYELLEAAEPKKYYPKELREILFEELGLYFADSITEEMLIDHLQNRVGLFLAERQ